MSRESIKVCIHCSATREGSRLTFEQCRKMHIEKNGWKDIGYNFYVEIDGSIHIGRPMGAQLAHAKGHNTGFIAICYEGGLNESGLPVDTRTDQQKQALIALQNFIERVYNVTEWCGHRDLSPDVNHDGVITPDEWMKACPCFDVKSEFA
ncbi:N-acetylmuramoyl-L-alanine amidase [Draconibacterium orientale]|uniref:N-acetylmuramoyl-L-alanine amidase n=1 Tax=Draconibacterium orientale TaxID=1168034 RepID=UPI0029BFC2C8|nr:N-acetylmuramoyl-L-alanine amidase [Draconibacterium orientale]